MPLLATLLSSVLAVAAIANGQIVGDAVCAEFDFIIEAGATNTRFSLPTPKNQAELQATVGGILSGTINPLDKKNAKFVIATRPWKLHGQFCTPLNAQSELAKKRASIIQVSHHSAFDTGLGELDLKFDPAFYSYQREGARRGYSTLVFDRLGQGKSEIPKDALNVVQTGIHVEIMHQIVKKLKDGTLLQREFKNVIGVGHSYGASLINKHVVQYPKDFHSTVFLGYTHSLNPKFPGLINATIANQDNTKLPNLLEGGNFYLDFGTIKNRVASFFFVGGFDKKVLQTENGDRGTFAFGEFLTLGPNQIFAPKYKGHVAYFAGNNDEAFCPGNCKGNGKDSLLNETHFFPKAASFTFKTVPKTGHAVLSHLTAKKVQSLIFDFSDKSFKL